jgi:1-acyl-sn-glycerol-3-phosphate acyltransferase
LLTFDICRGFVAARGLGSAAAATSTTAQSCLDLVASDFVIRLEPLLALVLAQDTSRLYAALESAEQLLEALAVPQDYLHAHSSVLTGCREATVNYLRQRPRTRTRGPRKRTNAHSIPCGLTMTMPPSRAAESYRKVQAKLMRPNLPSAHPDVQPARPRFTPRSGPRWQFARAATAFLRRRVCDLPLTVHGLEHLPPGEPLIVAAGPHRNGMDAFLLLHALPSEPRLYFLGSREAVARRPLNRALIDIFGGMVPVSTEGQLNREALEVALAILADGASLGIFPEGADLPNMPDDRLAPIKRGVAFLALRSGRRVLPIGLPNSRELWRGRSLEIQVGPPLEVPTDGDSRQREATLVASLVAALEALRPPAAPAPPLESRRWRWLSHLVG